MAMAVSCRMQRFCENVRRCNTPYLGVRYASGLRSSSPQLRRAVQQRLNWPRPQALQQRRGVDLHIQPRPLNVIDGKGPGHQQQSLASIAHFETEILKPDNDIDLPKAAALLALHADEKANPVNLVFTELSRLKTEFQVHAADNVPLAAPLPQSSREHALADALCDFLKAEGFEGSSLTDYYRAENSMLHSVLASKRGSPISLALLYSEVGLGGGLRLHGAYFPRHTLLRYGGAENIGFLDPFSNRVLSRSEVNNFVGLNRVRYGAEYKHSSWNAPISNAVFLRRMALNLQSAYQRHDNSELAARLTPYITLLDERVSMLESSSVTGGDC